MNQNIIEQIKDILIARGLLLEDLKNPNTDKARVTQKNVLILLSKNNCSFEQMAKFLDIPVKTAASIVLAKEAANKDSKSRDINAVFTSQTSIFTRTTDKTTAKAVA